jgi:hypothetical protein
MGTELICWGIEQTGPGDKYLLISIAEVKETFIPPRLVHNMVLN